MKKDIKAKVEELKNYYDNSKFQGFFTDDCENVTHINFDEGVVYYNIYVTASCGCCSEIEDRENNLDTFIEYLSEEDYKDLLECLK